MPGWSGVSAYLVLRFMKAILVTIKVEKHGYTIFIVIDAICISVPVFWWMTKPIERACKHLGFFPLLLHGSDT